MRRDQVSALPLGSSRRRTRVLARLALVALAAIGGFAFGAPGAHAHAELTSATPAESAVLASPPTTLRLTFTEDLMPAFVTVTLSVAGATPKALRVKVDGRTLTAPAPSGASAGRWVTAYRVVSVDGHAMSGTIPFTVRAASPARSTEVPSPPLPTTGTTTQPLPPAQTSVGALDGAPVAGEGSASFTSERFRTARSDLGWWLASAVCLVSSATLAKLGQKRS